MIFQSSTGQCLFHTNHSVGKEYVVYIPKKYSNTIVQFIQTTNLTYPFLSGKSKTLSKSIDNNYRYYYNSLKKSVRSFGHPEFATHDFRRNFINDAFNHDCDLRIIQATVGHSGLNTTVKYIQKKKAEEEIKKLVEDMRG